MRSQPKKQRGATMVEYLAVAAALILTWNIVDVVKDGLLNHQTEYTWSIAQPHI